MPRYTVTCSYETKTGGCSWATLDLDAENIVVASREGARRISADGRRKVARIRETKARLIDTPRQFEQARFVQHGDNQQQVPK